MPTNLDSLFHELRALLHAASAGLDQSTTLDNSTAKDDKPALHLYGKIEVAIGSSPKRRTCFACVIRQKHHVGFYFMPYYGAPDKFPLSPALRKPLSGKACFNFKPNSLAPELKKEITALLQQGKRAFQSKGWL